MPHPSAPVSDFARRLLTYEAAQEDVSANPDAGLQRVCLSLHQRLAPLIGSYAFHTMFARAVKLGSADCPLLAGLSMAADAQCSLSRVPSGN